MPFGFLNNCHVFSRTVSKHGVIEPAPGVNALVNLVHNISENIVVRLHLNDNGVFGNSINYPGIIINDWGF